jgi:hypothetical protein
MKSPDQPVAPKRKTLLARKATHLTGKAKKIGKQKAQPRVVLGKKSDRELVRAFGEGQ